jgi:hypothetical protein
MAFRKKDKFIPYFAFIALFISLAFRLINLGNIPLSNFEAGQALQALALAQNTKVNIGSNVTYTGLTGSSFFVFNSSDFLARFWPAFIGSLITLVPFLFRKQIGNKTAIILGFVLAISPEMVGLSRIISSPMAGMVFLLLFIGFFLMSRPIYAGMSLALGLMSGYSFWMGAFFLVVSVLVSRWGFGFFKTNPLNEIDNKRLFWVRFGLSFAVTIILVATGFFTAPEGLTGVFAGLSDFIQMFTKSSLTPIQLFLMVFIAYVPAGFLLGIWRSIRALITKEKFDLFLLVWWVFGFLFIILCPGCQPADLVWVSFPLWLLAVRLMIKVLTLPESGKGMIALTAIVVIILSFFVLLMVRSSLNLASGSENLISYFIAIIAGVVLLSAVILLIAYGWSQEVAVTGAMFGLLIVIFTGLIALSVNTTGLGAEEPLEVWYPNEPAITSKWVVNTIDRVLMVNANANSPNEIVVSEFDTSAMQWALHQYDNVLFVPYVTPQSQPGILITRISESPEISERYQGQDLIWSRQTRWDGMNPYQYLRWMFTREVTIMQEEVIIWVRSDLMPSQQNLP